MNTIDVPSCDEYLRRIDAAGGKTIVPKMPIPGVGWLAYCTDPEGNGFGIMQADESAAG
jgi:predicted enzyme related to lactoylglutathione lyase